MGSDFLDYLKFATANLKHCEKGEGCIKWKGSKSHSCVHVSDEYRKLCTVAALLPARPELPPGRPDIIPPPLIPGVYPPQQPEIVYPSRAPPPHGKKGITFPCTTCI